MKTPLLIGIFSIFALTNAQDPVKGLPLCATSCVNSAISSTGCQSPDVKCFCEAHQFQQGIAPCIESACGPADQEQTEQYARGICSIVGVDLPSFQALLSEAKEQTTSTAVVETVSTSDPGNHTSSTSGTKMTGITVTPTPTASSSGLGSEAPTSAAGVNAQHIFIAAVVVAGTGLFTFLI